MQILKIGTKYFIIYLHFRQENMKNFPNPLRNLSISDEHIKMMAEHPIAENRAGEDKL